MPYILEVERGYLAVPHERWAELAKRLHDTEHAGDDTTSVGEPDQGGDQDETASATVGADRAGRVSTTVRTLSMRWMVVSEHECPTLLWRRSACCGAGLPSARRY